MNSRIIVAVAVVAVLAVVANAAPITKLSDSEFFQSPDTYTFAKYVEEFDRHYYADEYNERHAIFNATMRKIAAVNQRYEAGTATWRAGVNKFTDLTVAEFKSYYKGYKKALRSTNMFDFAIHEKRLLETHPVSTLPASIDWRTKGVVSDVKDQGGCGSCWAFSSTEAIESAVAIATGKAPPILAPQQFVDCVPNPNQCGGTGGCEGATQPIAFNYTIPVGLASEADYPYQGQDGTCDTSVKPTAGIKGYVQLASNNWTQLMTAVAHVGPVSISVAAEPWQIYSGGVFSDDCQFDVDHAVMSDGYGFDTSANLGYWLVRNSWGADWGEDGYIRVQRSLSESEVPATCGQDTSPGDGFGCAGGPSSIKVCGLCGILSDSSYPTGAFLY